MTGLPCHGPEKLSLYQLSTFYDIDALGQPPEVAHCAYLSAGGVEYGGIRSRLLLTDLHIGHVRRVVVIVVYGQCGKSDTGRRVAEEVGPESIDGAGCPDEGVPLGVEPVDLAEVGG